MKSNRVKLALELSRKHPKDFTLQYPPRREYFKEFYKRPDSGELLKGLQSKEELNLYFHVPYCEKKCSYCNFAVSTRNDEKIHEVYVDSITRQLELFLKDSNLKKVGGIDIGGGTPTLLSTPLLERLLESIYTIPGVKKELLSIESTPKIAATEPEKLRLLSRFIGRVSMGVQSTEASMLSSMNRGEQASYTKAALHNLINSGFQVTNLDLIFGLPGQSLGDLQQDLETAVESNSHSITTYDCLYRGKGRLMTRKDLTTPSQEVYGRLYDECYNYLHSNGFNSLYGSVNHSRGSDTGTSPYFENRLLRGEDFVGFGNYSTSLYNNYWGFAPASVKSWSNSVNRGEALPFADYYELPLEEAAAKHCLLSLSYGVLYKADFVEAHGVTLEELYSDSLSAALELGLLEEFSGGYRVTEGSFEFMPTVRSLFYTESALRWLSEL